MSEHRRAARGPRSGANAVMSARAKNQWAMSEHRRAARGPRSGANAAMSRVREEQART
jgi:hypothetical protein